ncbi:hypothetical protein HPB51_012362 [Rhipicephalus microplus]|uniref:C2H2-type domain-containing protein n=1 Tax=Rhipicephalus microplus TaxID=6941 RepID=A0A9J6DGQ6_RHIMP|nr:hypothetical protein HPB51_012362 [Rhipicephalus microplus]
MNGCYLWKYINMLMNAGKRRKDTLRCHPTTLKETLVILDFIGYHDYTNRLIKAGRDNKSAGLNTVHPRPVQPLLGFTGRKSELKCLVCGYSTIYGTTMKIHLRTHTGERPFKCDHCSKAMINKGNRVMHVRTRTGERPFHCHLCPRVSTRKKYLAHHLNTHDPFG